jgi:uncharacterized protein YndB with AHSA1/START domain
MQNAEPIIVKHTYNAPASRVWKALTDKDEMAAWYFKLDDFKAEVGFNFQFTGGSEQKQYLHLCEVTEVIPNKKLTHSWRYDGYPGNSFVTWELEEKDGKTELTLTHIGLESFPQDMADFARSSFAAGWDHIVNISLAEYLAK